jgi:hypothetical protein
VPAWRAAQAAVAVDRDPPRVERPRDEAERRQLRLEVRMAAAAEPQADLARRALDDGDVAAVRDVEHRGRRERRLLVAADALADLRRGGERSEAVELVGERLERRVARGDPEAVEHRVVAALGQPAERGAQLGVGLHRDDDARHAGLVLAEVRDGGRGLGQLLDGGEQPLGVVVDGDPRMQRDQRPDGARDDRHRRSAPAVRLADGIAQDVGQRRERAAEAVARHRRHDEVRPHRLDPDRRVR